MTMMSRMMIPAVARAAMKATSEMFLTLSSELTAVSRLRWPWVTSALSVPRASWTAVLVLSTFSMLLTVTIMVESSSGVSARVWASGSVT
ncbi:hypothetical protein D3C73_1335390 [compost metagenome]